MSRTSYLMKFWTTFNFHVSSPNYHAHRVVIFKARKITLRKEKCFNDQKMVDSITKNELIRQYKYKFERNMMKYLLESN
jgi:hypothetical protein